MGSQGQPLPPIMAVKFLALVVLIFLVEAEAQDYSRSSLDRFDWDLSTGCNNSEPFFIKNRSTKTKKPYLTVDLATNAVNGGAKTGEENQQWMWSQCYSAIHLVNVATGGCLTSSSEGKGGLVSADECRDNSFWELWDGTLMRWGQRNVDGDYGFFSESFFEFARLVKRKSALRIVNEVKYLKGTSTPWDWFLWDIENV